MAVYSKTPSKIMGDEPKNLLSEDVMQLYPDTCAIKSQQLILQDYGIYLSEDQLVNESIAHGWYTGNGTSPDNVGNLLELHGIHCNHYEGANIFNLTNELAQGHKIIVGVDSGELWDNDILDKFFEDNKADHALIVSGIDTSDPNNVKVILTDPGTGDLLKEYPMDKFVDAWQDSNCYMITTETPQLNIFDSFTNLPGLDFPVTNLPTIGMMPYDLFYNDLAFLNYTYDIPPCVYDDFTYFVGGDISAFSPQSMDFFNTLIM